MTQTISSKSQFLSITQHVKFDTNNKRTYGISSKMRQIQLPFFCCITNTTIKFGKQVTIISSLWCLIICTSSIQKMSNKTTHNFCKSHKIFPWENDPEKIQIPSLPPNLISVGSLSQSSWYSVGNISFSGKK
jgi:hypothetical protein